MKTPTGATKIYPLQGIRIIGLSVCRKELISNIPVGEDTNQGDDIPIGEDTNRGDDNDSIFKHLKVFLSFLI